ncbi:MAG: radical SAM protein, partial [Armatimonadota bacterium]|nr:radical SAM protein [Armatimonadota bacterium]
QTPVSEYDALGFSISFEMDYLNILQMLSLSGIPLLAAERNESHPLILAGGPCATFNPEPLADFIDVFLVGEAEDAIPDIIDVMRSSENQPRKDLLHNLAQIEGVYVPRFYQPRHKNDGMIDCIEIADGVPERVIRRRTKDLDSHNASSVILTPNTEFADMVLTEAMRGCRRQCRFCIAGYMDLPPRPRKVNLPEGASRVGLVGSAVFDHPAAQSICEAITEEGREFSVSSIRIETLTKELADLMRRGGQETITLAPEAGTERLRKVINKDILDSEIMDAVEVACSAGFKRARLYFMVGLPTETGEDVAAIGELANRICAEFPKLNLQLSASCYVPKPWTPFQWAPMASERDLSAKIATLRKAVTGNRRLKLNTESPRLSIIQGWLARGDRRLGKVLIYALESGNYARGIAEVGLDPAFYAHRERNCEEIFPWDHIDLGVSKDYLRREYEKAFAGKPTPPCNVPNCRRCGVC